MGSRHVLSSKLPLSTYIYESEPYRHPQQGSFHYDLFREMGICDGKPFCFAICLFDTLPLGWAEKEMDGWIDVKVMLYNKYIYNIIENVIRNRAFGLSRWTD